MKKKLPSLFFGAVSIICSYIVVSLTPVYVSGIRDLYGYLTFTDIDWGLTARNTMELSAATFFMFALAVDSVIGVILAYKKWDND